MNGCLFPATLLLLAAFDAAAAPQDPARVDGAQAADPAAVFAAPPQGRALQDRSSRRRGQASDGLLGQAWQAFSPSPAPRLSPERYRQAYGSSDVRTRLGRTYAGDRQTTAQGWIGPVLSQQALSPGQQRALQQGVRTARDAMDAMGRQLLPALQNLKRDFDAGLERAAQSD